jgi:hypothetical protein
MKNDHLAEELFRISCSMTETQEVLKYLSENKVSPENTKELAQSGLAWISPSIARIDELEEQIRTTNPPN